MQVFESVPKKWGNSIGITIPREVVKEEDISTDTKIRVLVLGNKANKLKEAFGTLKLKKPTQQAMDEIDEGYD